MTAYEEARRRVAGYLKSSGYKGPIDDFQGEILLADDLRILTQVPEAPVVNLVSDSYRGTNATGIRLGELEQHVATLGERVGQLTAVVDRILTAVEQ